MVGHVGNVGGSSNAGWGSNAPQTTTKAQLDAAMQQLTNAVGSNSQMQAALKNLDTLINGLPANLQNSGDVQSIDAAMAILQNSPTTPKASSIVSSINQHLTSIEAQLPSARQVKSNNHKHH